jgi:hypothetical protein
MCQISLTFEYSRMKVPSLSRGCEIAQFFVRYMGTGEQKSPVAKSSHKMCRIYAPQTKILEGRTNRPERLFDALFNVS